MSVEPLARTAANMRTRFNKGLSYYESEFTKCNEQLPQMKASLQQWWLLDLFLICGIAIRMALSFPKCENAQFWPVSSLAVLGIDMAYIRNKTRIVAAALDAVDTVDHFRNKK